jgi:Tfp pilus assembly protein PilE
MQLSPRKRLNTIGFTFAEVSVALLLAALFAAAVFASNQRLLLSLKGQKETTAATMAMQWRMEMFRASGFTNIANNDWVKTNILNVRTTTAAGGTVIDPFGALGSISEQFTIGVYPPDGSTPTVMSWDAAHPTGQYSTTNGNLANASLLKVDVVETWTSADGRSRTRQISTICGMANTGVTFSP